MQKIDAAIAVIDKKICKNIDKFDSSERGLLSQNILSDLRDLVEHVSFKAFTQGKNIDLTYDNIQKANSYVKTKSHLNFLYKFHQFLQISTSHYTLDEGNSERLMLKYYEYLLKIKLFLSDTYQIEVLSNIEEFPIDLDTNMKEYYEKIAAKISGYIPEGQPSQYNDRYYIQKIKPFFVAHKIYYEVTFTIANEKASKFDRVIAFTNIDMIRNYAVKLWVRSECISVLGKEMPILIIDNYDISIRPCELNNYGKIFGFKMNISTSYESYRSLMSFLIESGMTLSDYVVSDLSYYNSIKSKVLNKAKNVDLYLMLDESRKIILGNFQGSNILKYLLFRLNNKIIRNQLSHEQCYLLSNLYLQYGCIPFDQMPFNSSPIGHNPRLSDIFDCIDYKGREHELLARKIRNNTEISGQLYTDRKDLEEFDNLDQLIVKYNSKLYRKKHADRQILTYGSNLFIESYENDCVKIINDIRALSEEGINGYKNSVNFWLQENPKIVDSPEKASALSELFENSTVALIYGAAGTGKTTMIDHISSFFNDEKKIYLANTNPAVDNLKQKVHASNCDYYTIAKFKSYSHHDTECEILIIDECSTVSNADMRMILNKASFNLLILVGDVFQIESITFGNWFDLARAFIPKTSVFELEHPYRSKNKELLNVWKKVRNLDDDILEYFARNDYSINLDGSIFHHSDNDEIILCLNYDGLYGINNINKFLQGNNPNRAVQWGVQIYKVGDPILFNESNRFHPLIYNNSKGKIVGIDAEKDKIFFEIELDRPLNEWQARGYDFELINDEESPNSTIRFYVNKYKSTDDDDDGTSEAIVPFQIAYAISIHKAQGLEYNSVKIVITNEVDELVTHNIFYTAITRAKNNLKIYWTPETENKILKSFSKKTMGKDVAILSSKNNIKRVK